MEEDDSSKTLKETLLKKLEEVAGQMERLHLPEYVEYLQSPSRMFAVNFLVGIARGAGAGIGATVIAALIIYGLGHLVGLPIIGKFFADIIKIVQSYLHQ